MASHGSFTRAAQELFISQPTLSKQIAVLERALHASLFHREHDGVRLTAAGEALLPYARRMIAIAQEAEAAVSAAVAGVAKLTVGFYIAPGNGLLATAFAEFARQHPGLPTALRRVDWSQPWAGVERGQAQIGLMWVPEGYPVRGLRHAVLAREELVVVMSPEHPLAGRAEITSDDLRGEVILAAPAEPTVPHHANLAARSVHVVRTIDETVESLLVGDGVLAVPPSLVAAHMPGTLVSLPLRGNASAELLALWRDKDDESPEIRSLLDCLARACDRAW